MTYLDRMPDAPEPSWPIGAGLWRTWRWKRARQRLEYDLFVEESPWAREQWAVVKDENDELGVW